MLIGVLVILMLAALGVVGWTLVNRDGAGGTGSLSPSDSDAQTPASAAEAPPAPATDQLRDGDWLLESYRFVNEGPDLELTGTVRNSGPEPSSTELRAWIYHEGQSVGSLGTTVQDVPAGKSVPVVMTGDAVWRSGAKVVLLEAG
jgi:hypothetical protein